MKTPLKVMLVESHPGAGDDAERALEEAGHRVLRCFHWQDDGFPCRGVTDPEACPVTEGADVAVLVRRGVAPRPTRFEVGVPCAIRAGIPIVEEGTSVLDPYERWLAGRADRDVVAACARAADAASAALCDQIGVHTAALLLAAGVDPASVECRIVKERARWRIEMAGPPVSRQVEQALSVRVLDAIRSSAETIGQVDVSYRAWVEAPS